jgi:hypothetical protein
VIHISIVPDIMRWKNGIAMVLSLLSKNPNSVGVVGRS